MEDQRNQIKRELQASKTVLTKLLNKINNEQPPLATLQSLFCDVKNRFQKIKDLQDQLIGLTDDAENENMATVMVDYQFDVQQKLSVISDKINEQLETVTIANSDSGRNSISSGVQLKLPELTLPKFSDNKTNLFNYVNFRSAFLNAIMAVPEMMETTKFIYLRAQLSGKAYNLVENLAIDETTYGIALAALDKEFLNRQEIFNASMSQIMNQTPANNLDSACQVVLNFKTNLIELNKIKYNFQDGEATRELVSMILRSKLPKFFTVEIARACGQANPSYTDIIENYQQVRRLLADNNRSAPKKPESDRAQLMQYKKQTDMSRYQRVAHERKTHNGEGNILKNCKFCNANNHFSANCVKYRTHVQRINRARELKLCVKCLSAKHFTETCSGSRNKLPFACKICKGHDHVTPICKEADNPRMVSVTTD